jgi:hypothetical protein
MAHLVKWFAVFKCVFLFKTKWDLSVAMCNYQRVIIISSYPHIVLVAVVIIEDFEETQVLGSTICQVMILPPD